MTQEREAARPESSGAKVERGSQVVYCLPMAAVKDDPRGDPYAEERLEDFREEVEERRAETEDGYLLLPGGDRP